jgi:L-ascorbate metabolism protein UlaG (beta-lactamase superfamily)
MHIEITWLGGASIRLKGSHGHTIFIDPWLDAAPGNAGCPISVNDVTHADLVLVTHGDPGHYGRGDGVRIARRNGCIYAANEALCKYVVAKGLLPAAQTRNLEFHKLVEISVARVLMFPIVHPPWTPPEGYAIPREPNTGFVVTLDGLTILYAGDTVPGDRVYRSVSEATKPTVALLPIGSPAGSHGTLESTAYTVASIAEMSGVSYVIPHYNYVNNNPAVEMLRKGLEPVGTELLSLDPGEAVRFDSESSSPLKS